MNIARKFNFVFKIKIPVVATARVATTGKMLMIKTLFNKIKSFVQL